MLIVAPSFLALMTTPSIRPSSAEETWPVRTVWACAGRTKHATATVLASRRDLIRICHSSLAIRYAYPAEGEFSPDCPESRPNIASLQSAPARTSAGRSTTATRAAPARPGFAKVVADRDASRYDGSRTHSSRTNRPLAQRLKVIICCRAEGLI